MTFFPIFLNSIYYLNAHAYFDYEVICTGLLRLIFPMIRKKGKFVLSNPVLHRILWRKSQSLDFFCVILRELQKNFMDALYVTITIYQQFGPNSSNHLDNDVKKVFYHNKIKLLISVIHILTNQISTLTRGEYHRIFWDN